ncbi:CaiB/BaiF CoA-transferase family protein [Oceanicola sp. 22II-s10i]|uniref:CaiB/BaiF CoA transferase family protein n=1 Tax=Oceanicola sp. 22II-s10i TaxID=1317116 RepID=UPI000B526D5E|nr:CoA transferase [Oceanicola sp. 22II-s10i]
MTQGALSHIRVLELGSGDALAYCGKLFADFGAEVIKVEDPGGDPRRAIGTEAVPGTAAYWAFLNTNKLSVTADWRTTQGADTIRALLAHCDLLIDGRKPSDMEASALAHRRLEAEDPGLTTVSLSWFGPIGPYRDYHGTEAVARSLAGSVYETNAVDETPMLTREGQAAAIAGMSAFIPAAASLWSAERGGRRWSLSILSALTHVTEYDVGMQTEMNKKPRTMWNNFGRSYPAHPMPVKDGWLGVSVMTHAQWLGFCDALDKPEWKSDPRFDNVAGRQAHRQMLEPMIEAELAKKTAEEWFELGLIHKVPLAIMPEVRDLKGLKLHRERDSFGTVTVGDKTFDAPILPTALRGTPPVRHGTAPLPGSADTGTLPQHQRLAPAERAGGRPLEGLRILDLTMGWAGPMSVRQLAQMGADVIKVESTRVPDWFRGLDYRPPYHADRMYEKQFQWLPMNLDKRGITIDISVPEGRELVLELAKRVDVVIDGYAADAMPKFGLTYDVIKAANPRLVVVSMPAFGMETSWRNGRAYGSTLEQASGLPVINGRPEQPPMMSHSVFGDPIGGLTAAVSMLVGILHQKRTDEGQYVDIAQAQAILPLFAPHICHYGVTGEQLPRIGNRHLRHFPHNTYACLGTQQFLTIEVRSTEEWQALCRVMRRPDLGDDPSLATVEGRRAREDEIEEAIRAWALTVKSAVAMNELQVNGVPAGTVRAPMDILLDPHMMAVTRYESLERPFVGGHVMPVPIYLEGDAKRGYANRRVAPTLGQHNREVLIGELGMSDAEFAALEEAGVIGTEATTARPKPVVWPDTSARKAG